MKLLYLHNTNVSNQMANLHQVIHMCNAFSDNGVSVHLSLQANNLKTSDVINRLYNLYGKIRFEISIKKPFFSHVFDNYLFSGRIKNTIRKNQPDLVFCRSHLLIKPALKMGVPVVFESHNATLHRRLSTLDKYYKNFVVKAANKFDHFFMVAISQALTNYWIRLGVPEHKIVALHDGFDPALFNPNLSKNEARTLLGLDQEKIIATYTGSLYPNREIENILKLAESFPDVLFLVVGGPESQKTNYENASKRLGLSNIIFTGRVAHKKIPIYLYASDVLLALWSKKVQTINYCSPLKVFEYMAAGRLIIAHGFPTIQEVLRHNENAFLVEPDNYESLVKTFRSVILTNNNALAVDLAKNEAYSRYTWKIRAKNILVAINKTS